MRLTYLDLPQAAPAEGSTAEGSDAGAPGAPAVVVLHAEGLVGAAALHELAALVRTAGAGRVVAPVGNYASYPSGMEAGGTCWYRILQGYAGTDPISLATAVVQLGDLLDDLLPTMAGRPPHLVGWGQGAVVGLGASLLWPGRVASVACVDLVEPHLALLPGRCFEGADRPPVLLLAGTQAGEDGRDRCRAALAARGVPAETRPVPEPGSLGEVLTALLGADGARVR